MYLAFGLWSFNRSGCSIFAAPGRFYFVSPATSKLGTGQRKAGLFSMTQFLSRNERREVKHETISSRNHPLVKRTRALQQRAERDRTQLFTLEGTRFVVQVLDDQSAGHTLLLDTLLFCPALFPSDWSSRLVQRARRAGTLCIEVTPDVLHSLAQNDDPQGLLGVAHQQWHQLETIDPHAGLCWLVLDVVQSAGNLGTMLRTSEACGGGGLILLNESVDPYNSTCVRASMGALFGQKLVRATPQEFLHWKTQHGGQLVGTALQASEEYDRVIYQQPTFIYMGGERKGLTTEQQQQCDVLVRIPMTGRADSLNVAVAAGVMLYEVLRQRRVQAVA